MKSSMELPRASELERRRVGQRGSIELPLWVGTGAGVVTFLLGVGIQQRYQSGQWMRVERNLPALFPSQPK